MEDIQTFYRRDDITEWELDLADRLIKEHKILRPLFLGDDLRKMSLYNT